MNSNMWAGLVSSLKITARSLVAAAMVLALGGRDSRAAQSAGQVVAWGDNTYSQTQVPATLTNVVRVDGGIHHTIALTLQGQVIAWGRNTDGQTNVPSGLTNAIAVDAGGNHSLAVRNDGIVLAWGQNTFGQTSVPGGLTNAIAVAGGTKHSLALLGNGTVVGWGNNGNGQITIPASATNVVAIAAGTAHSLALRGNGTIIGWGNNGNGQITIPTLATGITSIAAGANFSIARRADGKVFSWGNNINGQTNIPSSVTNVSNVGAGNEHAIVVKNNGQLAAWGDDTFGKTTIPAGLSNAFAVTAGKGHSVAIIQFTPPVSLVVTSAYGTAIPPVGTNSIVQGTVVAASVSPTNVTFGGTQAVLLGWSGTASVPASGTSNTVSFTMNDDSSITWNWQEYFWLDTTNTGGGTINVGDMWVISGSNVTITPTALGAQSFLGWFGSTNGCTFNGTDIIVPMTMPRNIEGRFTAPVIVPSPSILSFTGQVFSSIAGQTLTVSNSGNGPLDYTVASDMFWLSAVNPAGLLPAGASTTHVVNVSSLGLDQWRRYVGHLTITDILATNNPMWVTATLDLTPVPAPSLVIGWGDNSFLQGTLPSGVTNVVEVDGGQLHSVVLRANRTVAAFGFNDNGQTNVPGSVSNIVSVAGGAYFSMAMRSSGSVIAWGQNNFGQTNVPAGMTNIVAIDAGSFFGVALRSNGTVNAWGYNVNGETNVPAGLSNVVSISAANTHSLALRGNGTVAAWGFNGSGETNVPGGLSSVVAVSAGEGHSIALLADGTVTGWGNNVYGQIVTPGGLSNVVAISAGNNHSTALRSDGTVVAWGRNDSGQTNVPVSLTNVVGISAGGYHGLAIVPAKIFIVTSANDSPAPPVGTNLLVTGSAQWLTVDGSVTNGGTNYVSTGWTGSGDVPASGSSNTVGITVTQDSTINWSWQTNFWLDIFVTNAGGYTDVTNGWFQFGSNVMAVATTNNGYDFTGWFGETNGCTMNGTDITIPMTNARSIEARFGIHRDIGVYPMQLDYTGQVFGVIVDQALIVSNAGIEVLDYVVTPDAFWLAVENPMGSLAPGQATSHLVHAYSIGLGPWTYYGNLAITDTSLTTTWTNVPVSLWLETASPPPNLVLGWGDGSSGQTNVPAGSTNVIKLGRGNGYHSLAVNADGTVIGWGNDSLLQSTIPAEATNVVAAAVGWTHSLAVRNDGSVVAWGYNGQSQTNIPGDLSNAVDVAAGVYHSLALTWDGTVVGWGGNGVGQITIPPGLVDAEDVAAGVNHSMALRQNGEVLAWGDNIYGQTNVPSSLTNAVAIAAGSFHSLALRHDGTVAAWGDNSHGQTDVPVGLTNAIAIAGGVYHSVAILADHTLMVWGDNSYGQSNFPAGLTNVVDICGGGYHSLALVPARSLTVTSMHGGNPAPVVGTNMFVYGFEIPSSVDASITDGGTQYVNTGWIGTGDIPATDVSNSYTTVLTSESSIDWQWGTNYFLNAFATGGGTIDTNGGWYASGTDVTIIATTNLGFDFLGWYGETNNATFNGTDYTITVPMTQARTIEARFSSPLILVQSQPLNFTGQVYGVIGAQSMVVSNIGSGILNYTITPDVPWLNVTNPVGTLAVGQSTTHVIRAYTRGLEANHIYRSRISIVDAQATNSPQVVRATISLNQPVVPPTLVVGWGDNSVGQTNPPALLTNALQISAGGGHSLAIRANGTVLGWGLNGADQTDVPAGLSNVIQIAAGTLHSLALRSNGTIVAWGDDTANATNVPPFLTNVVDIDAGTFFSLAVRTNGNVVGWGFNDVGQTDIPFDATNVVAVAAGFAHSLALRANGSIVAWGDNDEGQTNVPSGITNAVAIDAGDEYSMALLADGTVVAWGDNDDDQTNVLAGLTDAIAIGAGGTHGLALRSDMTVVSWGNNDDGQTNVPPGMTDAIHVSGGNIHSLALVLAQRLTVFSPFGSPEPANGINWVIRGVPQALSVTSSITDGGTQVVNIGWIGTGSVPAFGLSNHVTVAINTNSTINWIWASNFWLDVQATGGGIVNTNDSWQRANTNVVILATNLPGQSFVGWFGDTNGCTTNGFQITVPMTQARFIEARFMGTPGYTLIPSNLVFTGQVYSAISNQMLMITNTGDSPLSYSLTGDVFWLSLLSNPTGSVAVGKATSIVVRVQSRGLEARTHIGHLTLITDPVISNAQQIIQVSLILNSVVPPSRVAAWGSNASGQTNTPAGVTNAVAVSAGADHSVALRANGRVVAWGMNSSGQTNVPAALSNVIAIAAGWNHTLALRSNGTVAAWGNNGNGQTNVPAALSNVVSIGAGQKHSGALRSSGTMAFWGDNSLGQTNIPAGLTNIVALAVGRNHNLVLQPNGRVVAWGDNTYGQTNVPPSLTNVVAIEGGANFSVALKADGSLVAWGSSAAGQTNVPITVTNIMAIAAGSEHTLALRPTGRLASWGANSAGQTNVPSSVSNVVDISAGKGHSLALISIAPLAGGGGGAFIVDMGVEGAVPEQWLSTYGISGDALDQDGDGDGLSALEEYVAGMDPNDASSTFRIVAVTTEGGVSVVTFDSAADRQYTLEVLTDILSGVWIEVVGQSNVAGNGGTLTLSDANPPVGPHYYRVRVSIP